MQIREAGVDDAFAIEQLAHTIWPVAYGKIISKEQLTYMLDLIYAPDKLASQMRNGQHFFLLYDEHKKPVGFAAYALKPDDSPVSYRLMKLYVLPALHGKGLGKLLLQYVISRVDALGAAKLDLTVNRDNPAQYFYHKMGFEIVREEDTDIGSGFFMNDYVMEINV